MDGLPAATLPPRVLERARLSRDARFDGRFYVAVISTGIYCRPICPAPPPRRAHVRYFMTAAAAAEAGFRPCLRCRPEAAPGTPAWLGTSATVARALRLIQNGALDSGSVRDLSSRVGVGERHLHRLFVRHLGASPLAVAGTRRLHFAKHLLDETALPITRIAEASGFRSVRRFNDAFRRSYGRSPRELRAHGPAGRADGADGIELRLGYRPPLDREELFGYFAARALPGVEHIGETGYARTISVSGREAVLRVHPVAGRNALDLAVEGAPADALLGICSRVKVMFDLEADPAAIRRALGSDPIVGPLVRARPGLRMPSTWDPFETAARAILGQQISIAAARTIAARLVERWGTRLSHPRPGLTHLFPTPEALAEADLDGIGLTAARRGALRTLAGAVATGSLRFDEPARDVVSKLMDLPGIGRWTAEYVALRALGEPDAFPAGDLGLRRAMARAARVPVTEARLLARAEAWRPWRAYAALHLWAAGSHPRVARRTRSEE